MRKEPKVVEPEFYQRCADLLGTESTYLERGPYWYRTRWNNREPGSGRYPGFGTIRMFSPACIHVSLSAPAPVNRTCRSADEVYSLLKELLTTPS